ncbi:MAG TPA: winged helix-turn-helix transcriptional regulator [Nitrososphaerales archaeon]|nr:winged helix-turn-helix transcriptional regulator [Nitrososphaerales archaeon]
MEQVIDNNRGKEVSVRTAQLVQLLTEIGPDIPEIARSLGQFKESVRYRYKEKILNKGFAVQASVDHERLGLKRLVAIVGFTKDYEEYAQAILTAMSELCYVQSFARSFPNARYVVNFSVPAEHVSSMSQFLNGLRERGMFDHVQLLEFEWFRNPAMKAEFYDFDQGRWDFDFAGPHTENFEAAAYHPSVPTKFDDTDLLVIRELQKDANKSLKEIADKLKLNYKKLAWHHNAHVVGRHLLRGYSIRWTGTRYDFKFDKALHRKHSYIWGVIVAKDVDELNMAFMRQRLNQLPFLWAEAGGRNYYAEFAFSVDYLTESLVYITEAVSRIKDRVTMLAMDQSNAISFTLAPQLFDAKSSRWLFNKEELMRRFENLVQQIKRESG